MEIRWFMMSLFHFIQGKFWAWLENQEVERVH